MISRHEHTVDGRNHAPPWIHHLSTGAGFLPFTAGVYWAKQKVMLVNVRVLACILGRLDISSHFSNSEKRTLPEASSLNPKSTQVFIYLFIYIYVYTPYGSMVN